MQAISERLAENSHDVWAVSKMKQLAATGGIHPDLIPYEQMTDQQKEYDRKASTDTLKCVDGCFIPSWMADTPSQIPDAVWVYAGQEASPSPAPK